MLTYTDTTCDMALECVTEVKGGSWALRAIDAAGTTGFLVLEGEGSGKRAVGYYDNASGNVFPYSGALDEQAACGQATSGEPAVRMLGAPDDPTGQLMVRQPAGNYLRICRWDALTSPIAAYPDARIRTVPQCGCGGSLGAPKLFRSAAEMCAYHFCAFYLA